MHFCLFSLLPYILYIHSARLMYNSGHDNVEDTVRCLTVPSVWSRAPMQHDNLASISAATHCAASTRARIWCVCDYISTYTTYNTSLLVQRISIHKSHNYKSHFYNSHPECTYPVDIVGLQKTWWKLIGSLRFHSSSGQARRVKLILATPVFNLPSHESHLSLLVYIRSTN